MRPEPLPDFSTDSLEVPSRPDFSALASFGCCGVVVEVGSWPHSQLCSAAVSFLLMDPRCPRVSYSLSDKMGDGGREPMGEVAGEISGSLKYWGFSMFMGKEPLTLILDEVSSLTSEFSIGSSESTKNELKDSSLGNLESNNEGSVVDIGVLDTTTSVKVKLF